MRTLIAAFMVIALAGAAFAQDAAGTQEAPSNPFAFKAGVALGADSLITGGPLDSSGRPTTAESWTHLGFEPEFSFGKWGVGLDLSMRFMLYPSPGTAMSVYQGDWVPGYQHDGRSFLDVYLPKILYVRYGQKGADPLFAMAGSIDDLTLGDGFIVGGYSNTRFMPDHRLFGLDMGVDGSLFGFPYVGFEALTGNLAELDVTGGRIFVRPLVGTDIPILKNAEVGATAAFDRSPDIYADTSPYASKPIGVYGADIRVPILTDKLFPLAAFTDIAFEPNSTTGWMIGAGGRLAGIFLYGAQLRVFQGGFIPDYFDANYDLYRAEKFVLMQESASGSTLFGWLASLGASVLDDKLVFITELDGPFKAIPSPATIDQSDYPHLKSTLHLGEGVVGGFFFDASYEKYFIGQQNSFFPDLVSATNAVIGLAINYRTGASVLTLQYNAQYDPATQKFDVTSSLSASVQF